MTDDRNFVLCGWVFPGRKGPAKNRLNAEQRKKVGCDRDTADTFGIILTGKVRGTGLHARNFLERTGLAPPRGKVNGSGGKIVPAKIQPLVVRPKHHNSARSMIR